MLKSKRLGIQAGLIWLVAVCLFPVAVLVGVFVYFDYLDDHEQLRLESLFEARLLMALVDSEFASTEASMQTLATSSELENADLPAFHKLAKQVLSHQHGSNVLLVDSSGQQIVNTAVPFGQPLPKAVNIAQMKNVLSTGKPQVSDMFMGRVLKQPLINIAVPVSKNGAVTHSLVAQLFPDQLQALLKAHRFPQGRIGVVFDSSSRIVALTGDIERFRGELLNPGLLEALKTSDEGSLDTTNKLGVDVVTSFTRSPKSRWGVAVGTPRAALFATLSQKLSWFLGIGALLFSGSFAFAWLLGSRITRAIHHLHRPAIELGKGRPVVVPALPIREIDEVGRAISRASGMLTTSKLALASSEAQMRGIVESATDAVVILDNQAVIVMFNAAAGAMFDCTHADAAGSSFLRFIPDNMQTEFAERLREKRDQTSDAHTTNSVEIITVRRAPAEEFKVELSFPIIVDADDCKMNVNTLVLRDITDRLRVQAALERSNLDLQQFAFVASHDLKTPLRSIGGFLQVLNNKHADKLDDSAAMLIKRSLDATSRLEQLTDDLLSYARVNTEIRPFTLLDTTEMVRDALGLLESAVAVTQATVTCGALPHVVGDRTQLIQLFMNLVGNGLKYCRGRAPVVHVSAAKKDGHWLFSVADNGIGIEAVHRGVVFEVFKRLHNQAEYPGTGIGLAICRRVVDRHGGTLWFTSVPGEGSIFYFTIPDHLKEQMTNDDEISV